MGNRRIYVAAVSEDAVRKALRSEAGRPVAWLYVGEQVRSFEACAQWLPADAVRLQLGAELQEVARTYKRAYLDYVGNLSALFDSVHWWLGSISEKNPYISKTFLRICHILTVARLVEQVHPDTPVILLVESAPVQQVLEEFLASQGHHVVWGTRGRNGGGARVVATLLAWLVRRAWFVLHHCWKLSISRLLDAHRGKAGSERMAASGAGWILLHGWVDERSFDAGGHYRNINLGNLAGYLEDRGWACRLVPMILSDVSYVRTVRALVRSGTPFLLPHTWLTVADVCRAATCDLAWFWSRTPWPPFEGLGVRPLLDADWNEDAILARIPTNLLYEFLVERWGRSKLPIAGFVYSYENHRWERAFCQGFRRAYPDARLVGYQDANVPELCLNFFMADSEVGRAPFPDLVVTNGRYSYDALRNSGHPKNRFRLGGAVRFQESADLIYSEEADIDREPSVRKDTPTVLVVTACCRELASELVWKTIQALKSDTGLRILVKCHPALPFSLVSPDLSPIVLPAHFEICDRPFLELLRESRILLYMDSTTSVEALAHGVPIVHVGSDWSLDLDTIGLPTDIRKQVRNPAQLAEAVRLALEMEPVQLVEQRRRARDAARFFFGPAGESAYAPVADALARPGLAASRRSLSPC